MTGSASCPRQRQRKLRVSRGHASLCPPYARFAIAIGYCLAVAALAMSMRLASIAIFVLFLLGLPARAQSFSREDLDCAVAATIADARADKGTAGENSFHELRIFFIRRLVAQDDQTNWARLAYDRSKLYPKQGSAELLAKCTELYQSSLHR